MRRLYVSLGMASATVVLSLGMSLHPVKAGFFERLFGIAPNSPAEPHVTAPRLQVTVRPRRGPKAAGMGGRTRRVASTRPTVKARGALASTSESSRAQLQVSIDPRAVPDWHLRDRTLRRGDILMLAAGPVVFRGQQRASPRHEDFVSLKRTDAVSGALKRNVEMAFSGIWIPVDEDSSPAGKRRGGRTTRQAYTLDP